MICSVAAVLVACSGDPGTADDSEVAEADDAAADFAEPSGDADVAEVPRDPAVAGEAEGEANQELAPPDPGPGELLQLRPEVLRTIDREPDAFTQGLELDGDVVFESSGRYQLSELRRVDPADWMVLDRVDLPAEVFAEGLTVVGDRIIVLTWQEQTAFVHDVEDLSVVGTFSYQTQGWGLCELGDGRLAMSDGTPIVTIRDPDSFEALDEVEVTLQGDPIGLINELECIDDRVWANVWQTDDIVSFDIADGEIDVVVDADGLIEPDPADDDLDAVLNGIAYLGDDRFLITGKLWPQAFEVRFVE